MRIICKDFHDYYDGVQSMGQDQTLIYHRVKKDVKSPIIKHVEYITCPAWYITKEVEKLVIGFCGRVYPLVVFNDKYFCYSLEEVDTYFAEKYDQKDLQSYKEKWRGDFHYDLRRQRFYDLFEYYSQYDLGRIREIQEGERSPIFVVKKGVSPRGVILTHNDRLTNYGFQRIFDPYTAYQEIAMFLGNLASPERPIPEIDNDILLEAKGFNKFSFRKDKHE